MSERERERERITETYTAETNMSPLTLVQGTLIMSPVLYFFLYVFCFLSSEVFPPHPHPFNALLLVGTGKVHFSFSFLESRGEVYGLTPSHAFCSHERKVYGSNVL